jgi:hypothetical protein
MDENILRKSVFGAIKDIKNHRYKSWEHCYFFFKNIKDKENISDNELDLAQLHLAFYLASWGMYRGSCFILQKDYTIFKKIVKIVLDKTYFLLWDLDKNMDNKEELIRLFSNIYKRIEGELKEIKESVKNHPDINKEKRYLKGDSISYTLITKILLGTIGCIPAYDTFFMEGLGISNKTKRFDCDRSFGELLEFYEERKQEINDKLKRYENYTPMKIIDMYFWDIGYNKDM